MNATPMDNTKATGLPGRKAEASANDERILTAARAVFISNPEAPISEVAAKASVGISALYRRYASKEDLLRKLCGDGLRRYVFEAQRALKSGSDPWTTLTEFMRGVVEADTHSLTLALAGKFTPTEELFSDSVKAQELTVSLFERARSGGVLRGDLEVTDLSVIFEQLSAIHLGDEARTTELRQRYLSLHLEALRAPGVAPLPGSAPTEQELGKRWAPR